MIKVKSSDDARDRVTMRTGGNLCCSVEASFRLQVNITQSM